MRSLFLGSPRFSLSSRLPPPRHTRTPSSKTRSRATRWPRPADVPEDFVEETAFDDLLAPASIAFSPDGRVFVGQLDGVIKVYDSVEDTTPSVYADLSRERRVAQRPRPDRHGARPRRSRAAARTCTRSYTYDAAIGGTAPRWNDNCPDPPGAERDGCVVSGRLSKILPDGSEQPLIKDEWCQQYPSHSLGDLQFGVDGALYITAGDGASYTFADYGQDGSPTNPCGDPRAAVGRNMTPPTAEGGALRSQDARTTGDPTGLDGAMLRVDPDTGDPLPDNPGTGDLNARRIIAYGFRNPFRFAFRPGTTDAYVGDVGWLHWEEIDRVPDTTSQVRNYGWPCYEGIGRQSGYEALGVNLCRNLYSRRHRRPAAVHVQPRRERRGRGLPGGQLVDLRRDLLRGRDLPARLPRRDVLRRLRAQLHLGDVPGRRRAAQPGHAPGLRRGASTPVDLEIGPERRPVLRRRRPRHDPARSARSTPTRPRPRRSPPRRTTAPRRCTSTSTPPARPTRTATRCFTPGTSTATAPTTTRRRSRRAHVRQRGHGHRPPARHRSRPGSADTETTELDGRHRRRRRRSPRRPTGAPTASATASTSAARRRLADGTASRRASCCGRSTSTTARRSCPPAATCTT